METHGRIFSKLYFNMVRAGQASGTLNVVFQRLAEFEESSAEWKSHLISAMIYPALITAAAGASLAVLMNFVVPRFAEVFESTGMPMPLPTAILLKTSQWIGSYGWIAVLAVIVAIVIFRRALRTTTGPRTVGPFAAGASVDRRVSEEGGDGALFQDHGHTDRQWRSAGAIAGHRKRNGGKSRNCQLARSSGSGSETRRRLGSSGSAHRSFSSVGSASADGRRRNRQAGQHV